MHIFDFLHEENSKEVITSSLIKATKALKGYEFTLYHISLDADLPEILKPHQPTNKDGSNDIEFTEDLPPRISFAPSIEQCFYAIYPNVSEMFEEKGFRYLDFYVYIVPSSNDIVKFISNEKILSSVHDAHMTNEVCAITPIPVTKINKVRITPTKKEIWYYPYNNTKETKRFLSPEITVNVLESYS